MQRITKANSLTDLVTLQNDSTKTIFILGFHPIILIKNALRAIGMHVPGDAAEDLSPLRSEI